MDRPIKKTNRAWKKPAIVAAATISIALVIFLQGNLQEAFSTVSVPKSQTTISLVQNGQLDDVISIRGAVQPLNNVYLDAISGGVVEQIHVEVTACNCLKRYAFYRTRS
ncbi:MAG: hypothetical protein R3332_11250 [Pseudohongiellaceae bacterium]|nr:hypothetical protein [Pseudohongiellaceae bacterium]